MKVGDKYIKICPSCGKEEIKLAERRPDGQIAVSGMICKCGYFPTKLKKFRINKAKEAR